MTSQPSKTFVSHFSLYFSILRSKLHVFKVIYVRLEKGTWRWCRHFDYTFSILKVDLNCPFLFLIDFLYHFGFVCILSALSISVYLVHDRQECYRWVGWGRGSPRLGPKGTANFSEVTDSHVTKEIQNSNDMQYILKLSSFISFECTYELWRVQ